MISDPMNLKTLVSVRDEMEASIIMDALADHEIRATAVGGYTAGFLAEAPGVVKVVVGQGDLAQAQQVMAEIPQDQAQIDWSGIDFGDETSDDSLADSQPPTLQEMNGPSNKTSEVEPNSPHTGFRPGSHPYQFRITTLLILQTIVGVALAIWVDFSAAMLGVIVVIAGTFALVVAGTIRIGSDSQQARQEWTYLGRALIVGYILLALIQLF